MRTENKELMTQAREALEGKWGLAIGTCIVYFLIIGGIQIVPVLGAIASLIISGAMTLGWSIFNLSISRNQEATLSQIFLGFNKFGTALGAYLLMVLFVILWALLLIVPGIIAAISYSLTFYIIAEDDSIGAMDAMNKSKQMMKGNKWKYFCLCCRFIGWFLLSMLTLGIGLLWVIPYMSIAFAKFYDDVKSQQA